MPVPVFTLPGFALVATFTTEGDDGLSPFAALTSLPMSVAPNTPVTLVWSTFNVAKVRITALGSPPFDTGIISNLPGVNGGTFAVPGGFPSTQAFTLHTYDKNSNPLPPTSVYILVVT